MAGNKLITQTTEDATSPDVAEVITKTFYYDKRSLWLYCSEKIHLFLYCINHSAVSSYTQAVTPTFSRSIFSQRSSSVATFSRRVSMSILVPSIIASDRATSDDGDAPFIIVLGSASSPLMMRRRRRRLPGPLLPLPPPGEYLHSTNVKILYRTKVFTRDSIAGSAYTLRQFRPSVCLSVTRVDQSKTVEVKIMQFSP